MEDRAEIEGHLQTRVPADAEAPSFPPHALGSGQIDDRTPPCIPARRHRLSSISRRALAFAFYRIVYHAPPSYEQRSTRRSADLKDSPPSTSTYQARPWIHASQGARRAGICHSAFGFGGTVQRSLFSKGNIRPTCGNVQLFVATLRLPSPPKTPRGAGRARVENPARGCFAPSGCHPARSGAGAGRRRSVHAGLAIVAGGLQDFLAKLSRRHEDPRRQALVCTLAPAFTLI